MRRTCQIFYCDAFGERLCCADCPSPCANRCLNGPERCRLVDTAQAVKTPKVVRPSGVRMSAAQKIQLRRLLEQGASPKEAAWQLGVSLTSVYYHAKKFREEAVPNG